MYDLSVNATERLMKIGELSDRSGLSIDTIRYYERIGLLPKARRSASGHREYDSDSLVWIGFLARLKATGMPLAEMVAYARLRTAGPDTEAERKALLERHRDAVRAHIAELSESLAALDDKIAVYTSAERARND